MVNQKDVGESFHRLANLIMILAGFMLAGSWILYNKLQTNPDIPGFFNYFSWGLVGVFCVVISLYLWGLGHLIIMGLRKVNLRKNAKRNNGEMEIKKTLDSFLGDHVNNFIVLGVFLLISLTLDLNSILNKALALLSSGISYLMLLDLNKRYSNYDMYLAVLMPFIWFLTILVPFWAIFELILPIQNPYDYGVLLIFIGFVIAGIIKGIKIKRE